MNEKQHQKVDLDAITGLRGIACLHIVLFHALLYSHVPANLVGSSQMPMFFLISGFTLTIANGKERCAKKKWCPCGSSQTVILQDEQNLPEFQSGYFMQKRFARIAPLYWLTILFAAPLTFLGYGTGPPSSFGVNMTMSLLGISTWAGVGPFVINGPAWFVSTVFFFYIVFPCLLTRAQSWDNEKRRKQLIVHFVLQILFAIILSTLFNIWLGGWGAFAFSTMWPVSRLPIFFMGILAGLIRNEDPDFGERGRCCAKTWSSHVNRSAFILLFITIAVIVAESTLSALNIIELGSAFSTQIGLPFLQLQLIYGLTMDERKSFTSRLLNSWVVQQLGRISYAWYLVHEPMIYYLAFILNGYQEWPDDGASEDEYKTFGTNRLIPAWGVIVIVVSSFLLAVLLNRLFEEPIGNRLRPKKQKDDAVKLVTNVEKGESENGDLGICVPPSHA